MADHEVRERELARPEGLLVTPAAGGTGTGVLVLSGSSGRIGRDRARVVGRAGATALTYRWFGDDSQPAAIHQLPLESFGWAVETLAGQCDRVVLMGVSKSAEAFLSYAADDPYV